MPKADQDLYEPSGKVFALFREIRGAASGRMMAGEVWIERIGLTAATFERFTLKRRTDDETAYDLTAECRTLSQAIIEEYGDEATIVVRVGSKQFRVEPKAGQRMGMVGRTRLTCEGVTLWPHP